MVQSDTGKFPLASLRMQTIIIALIVDKHTLLAFKQGIEYAFGQAVTRPIRGCGHKGRVDLRSLKLMLGLVSNRHQLIVQFIGGGLPKQQLIRRFDWGTTWQENPCHPRE